MINNGITAIGNNATYTYACAVTVRQINGGRKEQNFVGYFLVSIDHTE